MKKLFLIFLFLISVPGTAFANISMILPTQTMEVTSAFGHRYHPIRGEWHYHSGCDLGTDYNEPIVAAADGTVTIAGWVQGYGNTIEILHDGDVSTLYGHNNSLMVGNGDFVRQGQLIALSGSTGNSTGPHCHFETYIGNELVDPGLFVPGLMAAENAYVEGDGGVREGGGGGSFDGYKSDNLDRASSFVADLDFAKPIRAIATSFINVITKSLTFLREGIYQIFIILMVIDLALGVMKKFLIKTEFNKEDLLIPWLIQKIIFYAIMLFFLMDWGEIIGNFAMYGFPELGGMAGGSDGATAAKILSDPTKIVQKGVQIITPLINNALDFHSILGTILFPTELLVSIIFAFLLFILFLILGIYLAVTYIEFYLTLLFSFTTFSLSGLSHTRKFASRGLNGVFAVSLNLMFVCLFAIMLQHTMETIVVDSLLSTHRIENTVSAKQANKITSKDDLMARMRIVESYWGNYHCDNGLGYYGAYQINKEYWDNWCADYEANRGNGPSLDTSPPYERFNDVGAYNTAPEPTDTQYPWSPRNQDIVTSYILDGYYKDFGSWEAAGRAWNQGTGGMGNADAQEYEDKLLMVKGSSSPVPIAASSKSLNMVILLKLTLVCLMFIFMEHRLKKSILKHFGGMGFKLTQDE